MRSAFDVVRTAEPNSAALSVHSKKFRPEKIHHTEAEAAIACDPLANWNGIVTQKRPCRGV